MFMFAVLHLFRSVLCPYENLVQMEVFPEVPHILHLMQSRQLPASRHPGILDLPWHLCRSPVAQEWDEVLEPRSMQVIF
jgi:hypothetical protein